LALELYFLLNRLYYYPHIIDKIHYFFYDIEKTILSNTIINLHTKSIQLCYNNYLDHNLYLLYITLPYSNFTHLYLGWNKLKHIYLLCRSLRKTGITHLTLCHNQISDIIPLKFLHKSSLKELNITNNKLLNINPIIDLILHSNIKRINISNNHNICIDKLIDNIKFSSLEYLFASSKTLKNKQTILKIINKHNKNCRIVLYINY
jgi:hypothetical protein